MIRISGGTFRMGSDRHYPEEAPVHRVAVDGFLIDRTPVTNRQFKELVRATGYVTLAEVPPGPIQYPGILPHMLFAGSLVFSPALQAKAANEAINRQFEAEGLPLFHRRFGIHAGEAVVATLDRQNG
jgi:formylglycine-generating enzyme required for sulfatase activity